eukprot:gnl/MRDRNA2_/MRDRNA2_196149_c0_seq1.p1 gnl/MRDRNA2_/MRDRNA2_196149_c0~~gnl/MRDRNA2_/MRDRNA2_196149_c0_seq1.p1  ORF type:complete len:185 (+),score=22.73 gnl/MRDRNA2_/MRDRNA2_196149_c0_seq1:91-645(+)
MSLQKSSYLGFTPTHWDDVQKEVFDKEDMLHFTSADLTHLAHSHEGAWSWATRNGFRDPFSKDAAIKARCPQRPIWYDKRPAGFGTYEATEKVAALYTAKGREVFLDRANEMPAKGVWQPPVDGALIRSWSLPQVRPTVRTPISERDLPYSVRDEGDVRDPRLFRTRLPACCYAPAHRARLGLV